MKLSDVAFTGRLGRICAICRAFAGCRRRPEISLNALASGYPRCDPQIGTAPEPGANAPRLILHLRKTATDEVDTPAEQLANATRSCDEAPTATLCYGDAYGV